MAFRQPFLRPHSCTPPLSSLHFSLLVSYFHQIVSYLLAIVVPFLLSIWCVLIPLTLQWIPRSWYLSILVTMIKRTKPSASPSPAQVTEKRMNGQIDPIAKTYLILTLYIYVKCTSLNLVDNIRIHCNFINNQTRNHAKFAIKSDIVTYRILV